MLASVADSREHFPAVMSSLLDCFRGAAGARLLQVGGHARMGSRGRGQCACVQRSSSCRGSPGLGSQLPPRPLPLPLQRRGGLVIQQLSQRLGGLRVYRELSRQLEQEEDGTFAAAVVPALNLILLTSSQLQARAVGLIGRPSIAV